MVVPVHPRFVLYVRLPRVSLHLQCAVDTTLAAREGPNCGLVVKHERHLHYYKHLCEVSEGP